MKSLVLFLLAILSASAPLQARLAVIGNLAHTRTVRPGEVFEGIIMLKNPDKEPVDARVFQSDYIFHADGTNDYAAPGKTPRSNAGWITLSPSLVKLLPGETTQVKYKGVTPGDAKLKGTFWSMIIVEPIAAPDEARKDNDGKVAIGLQTKIRFAIQIVTEVGLEGRRSLEVKKKQMAYGEGKRMLQIDIGNDGEKLLVPSVTVELFDPKGATMGRFDAGSSRIYPTCSVRASVDLTPVPDGKYTALVLMDSGGAQVMGAQYELELAAPALIPEPAPIPIPIPPPPAGGMRLHLFALDPTQNSKSRDHPLEFVNFAKLIAELTEAVKNPPKQSGSKP